MDLNTKSEAIEADVEGPPNAGIGATCAAAGELTGRANPLSKYETMENAKQVLAKDRRWAFESARAFKLRQNELHQQEALAAEEQAREQLKKSKESMDEHAARLMEEMKASVIKRFETDLYKTVRANVARQFELTKAKFMKAMENEVREELYAELEPVIEAELASKLYQQVKSQLGEELKPIIEAELREQAQNMKQLQTQEDQGEATPEQHTAKSGEVEEQLQSQEDANEMTGGLEVDENGDEVELVDEKIVPEAADAPAHVTDEPKCGDTNPLKRSFDDDEEPLQSSSKRSKGDKDHKVDEGGSNAESPTQLTGASQQGGFGSPLYPSLEDRVPQDIIGHSTSDSEGEEGNGTADDLENGNEVVDEDGHFRGGGEEEGDNDEEDEEYNEEEEDYNSGKEEEDEDEDEDGSGASLHALKAVIAMSNTQDTAFVIDDSDEEEGEGEEDDAEKTLVVESEVIKTYSTKAFLDESEEEDEQDEVLQEEE